MHLPAKINVQLLICAEIFYVTIASLVDNGVQAPLFQQEPISELVFSNESGSLVSCSAHGNPTPVVTWVQKDTGTPISSVPGLRQILPNGTLYFPPFAGTYYRADVHETVYRCKVSNQAGTILSRDVHISAVVRQPYDIRVEGNEVFMGNVAFLRCVLPEHVRKFVVVSSWFRGDEELLAEIADMGGRYFVTSTTGDLYIRSVKSDDNLKKFACQTFNKITRERKISEPVHLSVKDITTNMAPTTNQKPVLNMYVDHGNDIHLPCNIQGSPLPFYAWYRVSDSNALYPVPSSQRIIPSNTLLYIRNADERCAGRWVCKATNQFGEQRVEIRLHVKMVLSVHIQPQVQIVNSGGTAIFNCSIAGTGEEKIDWYHNGILVLPDLPVSNNKIKLLSPYSLAIYDVGRRDKGMYQCLVANKESSAQAVAELKLGEITPEIISTFNEQIVRPGQFVSFKCTATGSPPPQFIWQLDSQPIIEVSSLARYAIGQYVDISGDVISHLNITHVRPEDGGLYKCVCSNSMGTAEYSTRLNVYGSPFVRALSPIKAVAGDSFTMHCPFSGYPIEQIRWEKSGHELASSTKYELSSVQSGGALKIYQIDSSQDSGTYTCIVRNRAGEEGRREIELSVNSPPVIEPFAFPKNLQEGGRAQITCAIVLGDLPIVFTWKKDDHHIPASLQITVKGDEFFSMLVFKDISARHSGKYSCYASNSAATVNHTSELLVKVPPRWIREPQDTVLMLGNAVAINCDAEGYPEPEITWLKGEGKSSKEFKSIQLRNNSLTVDYVTDADEGYYMCTANNGIGPGLKKILHINVNEPARFETTSKNISTRRSDPISLSCQAKGDDHISIIWMHNNNRIDLNNYRISITEMQTTNGINSQLSITHSDRQDSGVYKCIAENPFGKSEHVIYVAVQEQPDVPMNLECRGMSSRSVKLSWKRPFDGNSPMLSYIVQYQPTKFVHAHLSILDSDDHWNSPNTMNITLPNISVGKSLMGNMMETATLAGLHPSTTYLIRMAAVNEIESSGFTETIVVRTQEEAPIEPPQNVQVQTGGIGELIVTWNLPPRDSWNGELIGYTVNCTEEKQNINYISTNMSLQKSIQVDGFATTKTTIKNLRTFRRYSIIVRAINSFGAGPFSSPVYGTTLEGVPEAPPQNVNCIALTSQSIKISWLEPPLHQHGGVIQGYKILYTPLSYDDDILVTNEVKRTSNLETYLHALHKAMNYSVRILAYTSSGDGEPSNSIYCKTEDDVPDAPAAIKASALTGDSILVSWLPPKHRNGMIVHYTVYSRETGRKGQAQTHMVRVDEDGNPRQFESRGLIENHTYDYWVTASTQSGEGEPTSVVSQVTTTKAPARIASFSQIIRKAVGKSLILECNSVGNPTPRARWFTRDRPVTFSPFYEIMLNGNLRIHSIEASLSGNYSCSAKNLFGEDNIVYKIIAMKVPNAPQINVHYSSLDSIRVSFESGDDGGAPILQYTLSYRTVTGAWIKVEITPENNAYTLIGLKCGTQYIIKMSAHNRVGDGQSTDEINIWTKGKKSQEPEEKDFVSTNSSCINLKLSLWNSGGCPISHFSIEHRPHGELQWTVLSSDISNSDETRKNLVFCDFQPAKWYQLKVSAVNDAGRTTALYNVATTKLNGERIPTPEVFPENELSDNITVISSQRDWLPTTIVGIMILSASLIICLTLKHRGFWRESISGGLETSTVPNDLKDGYDNRRNQQVYSASPVKTVNKHNDSEMYEIAPYATFSVSCGRTTSELSKTPLRGVTPSALDYSVQFKTFGHPDSGDNLNAAAYPVLPNAAFGHVKGKSSWQNQRYYNTDDDSTLSKSMTILAGNSQLQSNRNKSKRELEKCTKSKSRNEITKAHHNDTESDTSVSPINEFSNMSTYRVPTKSRGDIFRPDSSTESNNDNSPIERRSNTPRHVSADMRMRPRSSKSPHESHSMNMLESGSSNR
ncbi:cell adhesion molecule Dscam2 isoform X2 [Sitodiplosis mosellana]|uniref:cell adhesion molecule Dscam2 isoform X2 n=1 Tax=Sitodiplosis mosellana TaxID=263140 RepID=UPI0024441327|nr:cell adhesion molecule Dscam2 isoform X2 [Sitodiplosis mosellana]